MATPRWPVVLFDLDGTLVDSIGLIVASYQHAFTTVLGRSEDEARIRSGIGRPLLEVFRETDAQRAGELVESYVGWNMANTARLIRRYDGVDQLLGRLASVGARVAVVTSKRRDAAELTLDLTGLASSIDLLLTLDDTTAHKPNPEPLLLALDRLGALAADACYVGDAVVDLLTANAAGMTGIGVTWGACDRRELRAAPHAWLCDSVDELKALLVP